MYTECFDSEILCFTLSFSWKSLRSFVLKDFGLCWFCLLYSKVPQYGCTVCAITSFFKPSNITRIISRKLIFVRITDLLLVFKSDQEFNIPHHFNLNLGVSLLSSLNFGAILKVLYGMVLS